MLLVYKKIILYLCINIICALSDLLFETKEIDSRGVQYRNHNKELIVF